MADQTRFELWQKKIRSLLEKRSKSEIDVLEALLAFKKDERAWRKDNDFGWVTFSEMLKRQNFGVSEREFEKFEECVERLGSVGSVRKIGLKQAVALMTVPIEAESCETPTVPAYLAAFEQADTYVDTNGSQPPLPVVRAMIRQHYAPPDKPKRKVNKYDELKAYVAEIKAKHKQEVERLKTKYKAEVARLQEQIDSRDTEIKRLRLANRVLGNKLAKHEKKVA